MRGLDSTYILIVSWRDRPFLREAFLSLLCTSMLAFFAVVFLFAWHCVHDYRALYLVYMSCARCTSSSNMRVAVLPTGTRAGLEKERKVSVSVAAVAADGWLSVCGHYLPACLSVCVVCASVCVCRLGGGGWTRGMGK